MAGYLKNDSQSKSSEIKITFQIKNVKKQESTKKQQNKLKLYSTTRNKVFNLADSIFSRRFILLRKNARL